MRFNEKKKFPRNFMLDNYIRSFLAIFQCSKRIWIRKHADYFTVHQQIGTTVYAAKQDFFLV